MSEAMIFECGQIRDSLIKALYGRPEGMHIGMLSEATNLDRGKVCYGLGILENEGIIKSGYKMIKSPTGTENGLTACFYSLTEVWRSIYSSLPE